MVNDDALILRVAARFQAETESETETENEKDLGRYHITWLPQHADKVPLVEKFLLDTEQKYQAKGIPFKDKFNVVISGKAYGLRRSNVAAEYFSFTPPRIQVQPKALRGPGLLRVMIHEMAHYVHDKIVPGGYENVEIETRFAWAVKRAPKRKDDYLSRFELAADEWIPSSYSRTNPLEWFAEMTTSFIHGHLKSEPSDWLLSVIRTGKPPTA